MDQWIPQWPKCIITLLIALATHFGVVKEVAAELIFTVECHGKVPWDDIAAPLRQGPCFDNNGMSTRGVDDDFPPPCEGDHVIQSEYWTRLVERELPSEPESHVLQEAGFQASMRIMWRRSSKKADAQLV